MHACASESMMTPLLWAAHRQHTAIVHELLTKPFVRELLGKPNKWHQTALVLACSGVARRSECAEMILEVMLILTAAASIVRELILEFAS